MVNQIAHTINSTRVLIKIEKGFILSVITLGATSIVTQIILLREFLSVFYGNELVIGIVLANWMVVTSAGSYLGKYSDKIKCKTNFIIISLCLVAMFPAATVFLLSFLRNIVFTAGSMISIMQILCSSFVLLIPYCLLSGFLFTFFSHTISERYQSNLITKIYSWEAIGSLIGGFLFNIVMIYFLKTFQSLMLMMMLNLIAALILSFRHSTRTLGYAIIFVSIICLLSTVLIDFDGFAKRFLFQDQDILYYKDTPYGNLTVTKQADQKNFYENNVLLFSTNDVAANEEAVHYAMIQHPNPKYVLLISGGISGTTQEILKYNIDRIDYVEINPWLIDIGKRFTSALSNKKINVINEDARLYVRNTSEHYDVALINLPDPGTTQINRYYTVEFFQDLKRKLNKDAVISTSLLASTDYLSDEARQINSIMYNTLKTEFKNILIVPGLRTYFLASDNDLHIDIARMIEKNRINNSYVNQYYLNDQILKQRSSYIENNIEKTTATNKDFTPFSYYRQLLYWLSYFKFSPWIFTALCAVVFIVLVLKLNAISFGIFTGGFAASSIEVLLLIAFQIIYGNVYQITGIIITIFMAGLAVGIFFGDRMLTKVNMNDYIKVQLSIGVYAVLLPFVFLFLRATSIHYAIIHGIFFLITSVIAVLIGMEFFIASRLQRGAVSSIASKLYSIDLIGSAFGALIVSAYLIPLLGIINVCFIIALLNFTSGMISFMKRKNFLLSFA